MSTGELARALTRACHLVKSRFELGYRLTTSADRCVVTIVLDHRETTCSITMPASDGATFDTFSQVVAVLNDALSDAGRKEQFDLIERPGTLHERHRLVVRDDSLAIEPIDARVPTCESSDSSEAGAVGEYIERLCRYANLPHITCKPRASEPGLLRFWFDGSHSSRLLCVRVTPVLDIQTVLDSINTELEETDLRLYRIARDPNRTDVALLDHATAAELRSAGDLIEHPARGAIHALRNAGFELPSLYGEWRNLSLFRLRTELRRVCMLLKGIADLEVTVANDTVTWTIAGTSTSHRYGTERAGQQIVDVLAMICGDLNRALAAAGITHRVLVMTGEPHFYGHRMLVLDRAWLGRVARVDQVITGCLDAAMLASIEHLIGIHPPTEPATSPPRLTIMEEIIGSDDILDHDFKCSARPSDYFDLIEELAEFARLAIEVEPRASYQADLVAIDVTYRGTRSTVRIEEAKYVDVRPILDYLNSLLDSRKPRYQIYVYRGGGWSGGVVRATDDQATQLRLQGYIS